jgi:choline dehydrogenase-like flavoprotein
LKDCMGFFEKTVSALVYSICSQRDSSRPENASPPCYNDVVRFVLRQWAGMPDYLRFPMRAVTCLFGGSSFIPRAKPFHKLGLEGRRVQINAWRASKIGFRRDLARFYDSLAMVGLNDRLAIARGANLGSTGETETPWRFSIGAASADRVEVAVIGSGPGGAVTACMLAEGGRDVALLEEGAYRRLDSCEPFTGAEMAQKYRCGGVTMAMGRTRIAYAEGRCVGGGSEINSGLYHRTPPEILAEWQQEFQAEGLAERELSPFFEACERDVSVSFLQVPAPPASLKLHEGATRLGWKSMEVPRWFAPGADTNGLGTGRRQSMTETFIPRALRAGCQLRSNTRVQRLAWTGKSWMVHGEARDGQRVRLEAETVFVCGGAVQTPALLIRSGVRGLVGQSLRMHPTIKIIAEFAETVNFPGMGVPVHQVKEFAPRISFGCSISSPAFLGVGMLDQPDQLQEALALWQRSAVYYAMIKPVGCGTIRVLPGFAAPLVQYKLAGQDYQALADALKKLGRLLLEAGAARLYPGLAGIGPLKTAADLQNLPSILSPGRASLMTIHLFSSCPMGEDRRKCVTDSFGRVRGVRNLFINDASLLCTAPGVNPQGSVMAIARRNAQKFQGKL